MSKKSNIKMTVLFVLSASLIAAAATTYLLTCYYRRVCFHILGGFCESIIHQKPDSRQAVLELLKTQNFRMTGENILSDFGYDPSNMSIMGTAVLWIAVLGFLAGSILFLFSFWHLHKRSSSRIQALTDYLGKINTGSQGLILDSCEDEFSRLQDEIYKTVTALYQTRAVAITARNNFAENLSNIAHQLKTPITSISLTVQMAKEHLRSAGAVKMPRGHAEGAYLHAGKPMDGENAPMVCKMHADMADIERQIKRLTHLEEALLILSRIDAGTLTFERKPTDVFTILSMAADNLYELSIQKSVRIDVPEMGETDIFADLDWTMEALMNLMKNCIEAAEADTTVHCSYEKNPLYVQIRIWDEGEGFSREDLPRLFERFYRGKKAKYTGIGIGLSLSKAIIEMQNGIIRAFNLPNGGACFEIRFYTS